MKLLPVKHSGNHYLLIVLIFFTLFLYPATLISQVPISDSIVKERIQCIQAMLEQDRARTNLWWYGWLGGYSAATAGQGAAYFLSKDIATRQDMAVGAATTILGAAGQLITPLHPGRKAGLLQAMPGSTPEERRIKLATAEEYLKTVAMTEKAGRSWKTHALYSAVNLSSGLITWIGFKRSVWAGIGNFALNTAVSEIQIWTQPTRSWKNYQNYLRRCESGVGPVSYKPGPEYHLRAFPGGLGLTVVF